jgi:hypothetical protein
MLNHRLRLGRTKVLRLGASVRRGRFILKVGGVSVGGFWNAGNLRCFGNGALKCAATTALVRVVVRVFPAAPSGFLRGQECLCWAALLR